MLWYDTDPVHMQLFSGFSSAKSAKLLTNQVLNTLPKHTPTCSSHMVAQRKPGQCRATNTKKGQIYLCPIDAKTVLCRFRTLCERDALEQVSCQHITQPDESRSTATHSASTVALKNIKPELHIEQQQRSGGHIIHLTTDGDVSTSDLVMSL